MSFERVDPAHHFSAFKQIITLIEVANYLFSLYYHLEVEIPSR